MPLFVYCRSFLQKGGTRVRQFPLHDRTREFLRSGVLTLLLGATLGLFVSAKVAATPNEVRAEEKTKKMRRVVLTADGQTTDILTGAVTIEDVLMERRIPLAQHDRCSLPLSSPVKDGMTIAITRVRIEKTTERIPLPFPVRRRYSTDLGVGDRIVKQIGQPGEKVVTYRDCFRDGKRTERVCLDRKVTPPVPQIEVQGLRGMTLASRHALGGRRVITMRASAYGPSGNGAWGMRTATGLRPGHGVVAVDPRFIPLRTKLYIEGYGIAIAGDTGSAIKGDRIDLGMNSDGQAWRFGRRKVRVMILD
ncbi:MAG: 3D domain-containing protein [Capsulimonadales bacterium]|nr:3D domain-containing protein [Capsulimonadales bacterium]